MDDIRRIRVLAAGGNAWHFVEFGVALGAGIAAGSVALVAFGGDSLIEAAAGFVILWRFASRSENAERRAQQLVAASYAVLVAYVGVERRARSSSPSGRTRTRWRAGGGPTRPLPSRSAPSPPARPSSRGGAKTAAARRGRRRDGCL